MNQNLYYNKIPRWFLCTSKFERCWESFPGIRIVLSGWGKAVLKLNLLFLDLLIKSIIHSSTSICECLLHGVWIQKQTRQTKVLMGFEWKKRCRGSPETVVSEIGFRSSGKSSQLSSLKMAAQVIETTIQNLFSDYGLQGLCKAIRPKLGTAWRQWPWFLGSQSGLS
jgi:hypothetical protein